MHIAYAFQHIMHCSAHHCSCRTVPCAAPLVCGSWVCVVHHHLSLPFTIIIAIWPTNQCLVSSLEEAGACRQSYITISSSYHSLPPVTDTGRNWEEGKYRISSQSTCSQAKYITFLKMNKKIAAKIRNGKTENVSFLFFCLEDVQGI